MTVHMFPTSASPSWFHSAQRLSQILRLSIRKRIVPLYALVCFPTGFVFDSIPPLPRHNPTKEYFFIIRLYPFPCPDVMSLKCHLHRIASNAVGARVPMFFVGSAGERKGFLSGSGLRSVDNIRSADFEKK